MAQYRKIPVVVEAVKWTGDNREEINNFIGLADNPDEAKHGFDKKGTLLIRTLESGHGMHTATIGDYIIKGVEGEFYPCKPSVFEKTYEGVKE